MRVERGPKFVDAADGRYLRLVIDGRSGDPSAWEAALNEAVAGLLPDPGRHSLREDPAVQGMGLRQRTFGVGRKRTHRLVFRIDGDVVRLMTVRGLTQRDLTPRNL